MNATWPVVVDGVLQKDGRVELGALSAGLQHGEGLFETLPVLDRKPLFLAQHLERLIHGAEVLELGDVPPAALWCQDMSLLLRAASRSEAAVRLLLVRDDDRVRRIVAATDLPVDRSSPAVLGRVAPELDGPRALAGIKSLNYLVPRRAHALGSRQGFDEVLFTQAGGIILEGSRSTVFCVRNGTLWTPPLTLPILPGVTRQLLLDLARHDGMPVVEVAFSVEDLLSAEEVFITASLRGVRPARVVFGAEKRPLPGPNTRRLQDLYAARVTLEREQTRPCDAGERPRE